MQLLTVKIGSKRFYHDPTVNKLRNVENPLETRDSFLHFRYAKLIEKVSAREETEE